MRILGLIVALALLCWQPAESADPPRNIAGRSAPMLMNYETAWLMGYTLPPLFINQMGQTLSGNPVLIYYGELDIGAGGTVGKIDVWDGSSNRIRLTTPSISGDWTLTLPPNDGNSGEFLRTDGAGNTTWVAASGSGTVTGTGTYRHAPRWDSGGSGLEDTDWIFGDNDDFTNFTFVAGTDHAVSTRVSGDSADRFTLRADGALLWGDGSVVDTGLQRSQANTIALGTGDAIRLVGSAGDHAGPLDGMIHYNNSSNRFRFRENGAWVNYGDVVGPGSSTDNAMVLWDGTTGKLIKSQTRFVLFGGTTFGEDDGASAGYFSKSGFTSLKRDDLGGIQDAYQASLYSDDFSRWTVFGEGHHQWGDGANAPDNQLARLSSTQMAFSKGLVANDSSADADSRIESDDDANMVYVDADNNRVGLRTASPSRVFHVVSTTEGSIPAPVMTTAQQATRFGPQEGEQIYNSDRDTMLQYDGQRDRNMTTAGWVPFVYPISFSPDAVFTTALALTANGGSIAIPIAVPGHMLVESVTVRNTDTGTARSWRWAIYEQYLNNGNSGENTLTRVVTTSGSDAFTPGGAASNRTLAASTDTYLGPGTYWLVIQCTHATNNFGLGSTPASANFAFNTAQTKTTTNPNGTTVDFVAATWTKVTAMYAVRVNGVVFGQSTLF